MVKLVRTRAQGDNEERENEKELKETTKLRMEGTKGNSSGQVGSV